MIKGKRLGELCQFQGGLRYGYDAPEIYSAAPKGRRAVTLHLVPNWAGHKDYGKISQQVQAAEFVQVDQRPGVANHERRRVSFGHAAPTRHLGGQTAPLRPDDELRRTDESLP